MTIRTKKAQDSSDDENTLTETARWHEGRKRTGKIKAESRKMTSVTAKEISPPRTQPAERVLGIKTPEIYVRSDVDVESVASRDARGAVDSRQEGRQQMW